ncbi:RNA polymerase beta subunit (chloroplast) [Marchantia polymorpha subsp. ruderalis]|uniref:DNA-directed RNA polymerase subunit beta n=3 Tax=Marchantia polymorpha TaxID=3197 RepID=A0A2Z6DSZ9_MARPO|nr:RNA polymerase beta subunit [Marchantia polymorpha subsp. ruderalis]YP_009646792.1 RNA polymerase beta subunit [Marchantia polymorpha]AXJ93192.1 RNA polymerase beta' subunit [Marchantia polymorpha subsp. ruderalis]AZU95167.1 RNA polymerase beta subunit [Marchantia polymorpha]QBE89551.1 RNA polymerase beta subunit [Marchantia polymorpha subsp. ruderalis]BBD75054.1 RNA polymerase beta subunit [Marchantia polymorpha subsp. ruderalis]BDD77237.1 RNA polymerase beta subunit [Marchantia polymorph
MEIFILPEFGKIQFEGFNRFINQGLSEELSNFPIIEDIDQEFEFQIFGEQYQLAEPLLKERDAVYQSITYSSDVYVPAQLTQKKKGKIQKQIIFLGSIPLMNSQGTFVVNGVARVIINQILRSPGIYYNSELDHNGIPIYTGTLISNWGGRLKLEIDGKTRIWARISKKRKVSILVLLLAMGLNLQNILDSVCYPKIFLEFIKKKTKKEYPNSTEDAIVELYKHLYCIGGDLFFSESIRKELQKKFFQQRCELGKIGRLNLNKKLNLNVPENEVFLLPQDILAAVDYLIKLKFGIGTIDDIDHLKNRRVCSVADLLQDQLKLALNRLENSVRQILRGATKRKRLPTPKSLVTSTPLIMTFKEFFGSHPLSQFLDQTNPLTEIVHKRRLSSLGPGGLTRRTASFQVRDIHASHYGRICPIETSEGMNAGLIASLAIHAKISILGCLESPFYKISKLSNLEEIINLSAAEDEYYRIATGNCLALDQNSQEEQITPARYRQDFVAIAWEQVHLRSIFPLQYFSVGASLIPFLEHNDANRALMGSNMQRQAVPLLKPEKCIVGTGIESQTALDSGSVTVSLHGGKIEYLDGNQIILSLKKKKIDKNLIIYQRSNNSTCIHQKPKVEKKKYIKKGQILADGAATANGELALGKNILVAYMPWEGYNFEDAILINERLIYEDIYTSIHIERYEIEARVTSQGSEKFTNEIPHLDDYLLRHLDQNGVVLTGSWVETGDVLVGKLTPQETEENLRAPEGKLLQAIFGIQVATSKETCLKVPPGGRGRVIDIRLISQEDNSANAAQIIHIYILQKRKIQIGDKVAGRHGNKGIISKILPRQDMPFLQDGTPIDMILSPLGVPSRMNVGQIFECLLGLAGSFLHKNYRIIPFDERYEREASRKLVFSELYKASKKTTNPWLFEPDNPGKSRLIDGRTGEIFEQPITIGKAYMLKLIHQVDDKIHARSSGPYALVTQQPLRGRSRRGGQRVGEMEVWALEGFGVAYILQEMLTIKSDHIRARYEVLGAIVTGEPIPKPNTAPESFKLLVRELRSLALEINHVIICEKNLKLKLKEI